MSVILWLLGLELAGLAALPLAARVFSNWPDRGFASAKLLGLLVVGYLAWLTSMLGLTGFTGPTIVILFVGLALTTWAVDGHRVRASWREGRALALVEESLFLGVFAVGLWVRSYNAAIAGQEKPMDLTFLTALIRADSLPAEDPWLAGFALPYYYFGYLLHSVLAKLTAVEPAVAYNLAVTTTFALAALGAFGLTAGLTLAAGSRLRTAISWAALSTFGLVIMGNLQALVEALSLHGIGDGPFWRAVGVKEVAPATPGAGLFPTDGIWWFHAARVIPNIQPDGITEFPYFSFLLGDLHPHYMALPLGVLIVSIALHDISKSPAQVLGGFAPQTPPGGRSQVSGLTSQSAVPSTGSGRALSPQSFDAVRTLALAIVLGAVIPANTWDVPAFWGTFAMGSLVAALRVGGPPRQWLATAGQRLGTLFVLAAFLYFPYFIGYAAQPLGLGLVAERTPLGSLVVLFGPLLFLPALAGPIFLFGRERPPLEEREGRGERVLGRGPRVIVVGGVLTGAGLFLLGEPTLGFLVALLAVWLALALERATRPAPMAELASALLITLGTGALLAPELLFLRDVFGTRMNTVFKLYYDAWILLALAAPLVVRELLALARSPAPRLAPWAIRWGSAAGLAGGAALAAAGALYPIGATYTKSGGFTGQPTLDGMAHLRAARPADAEMAQWLRLTHPGARIVEAVGDDYSDAGRLSTFGAAIAPLGWAGHELQWRGPIPEIERRRGQVHQLYADPRDRRAIDELRRLGIDLVMVGSLERELYGAEVERRLAGVFQPAYKSGTTTAFRLQ